MATDLSRAVDQASAGQRSAPLHGSTGTIGFQASQQHADTGSNGLVSAMQNFVKTGVQAYGTYEEQRKAQAEERSNEIIRKLTPEQRRQAIQDGTLLYQDDPDAMNMLRRKTGRSAAYDVETEIQTKIQNGEFDNKDRQYVEQYRQQRLKDMSKNAAEAAGINEADPEFQGGFNADITQRNAGIFDLHAQRRSKWYQAQAELNSRGDLSPLLDDPNIMQTPEGSGHVAAYFNAGLKNGQFPSDSAAIKGLQAFVTEAANKDGGSQLLRNLGEQQVEVLGGARKVRDLMGGEVYDDAISRADQAAYKRNADRTRGLTVGIASALQQEDPMIGYQKLQVLRQQNQWVQNGPEATPQKSALDQAEAQLLSIVKQRTAQRTEQLQKATQADNRMDVLDRQYQARISGKNVSVNPKDQAVDGDTGEFKDSDGPTFAARIMDRISSMDVPEEKREEIRAQYLNADFEGGPFQTYYKTLITDAQREWANSVRTGQAGDMPRLKELQAAYAKNSSTIGAVFPDQADFLENVKDMAESGADMQILIDAEKSRKGLSLDEKKFRDDQWSNMMNDTRNKDLSSIPGPLQRIARNIYDGFNERTGNPKLAAEKLTDWLQKNTVAFSEQDDDSAYIGRLDKRSLMASPQDVNSWQAGKAIVEKTMAGLRENPQWADATMSVRTDPTGSGDILIDSPTGRRVRLSKQSMQLIYQAEQRAAEQKAMSEAVDKTQTNQMIYNDFVRGGKGPL